MAPSVIGWWLAPAARAAGAAFEAHAGRAAALAADDHPERVDGMQTQQCENLRGGKIRSR